MKDNRMEEKNAHNRLWLIYWGSITDFKILELWLGCWCWIRLTSKFPFFGLV